MLKLQRHWPKVAKAQIPRSPSGSWGCFVSAIRTALPLSSDFKKVIELAKSIQTQDCQVVSPWNQLAPRILQLKTLSTLVETCRLLQEMAALNVRAAFLGLMAVFCGACECPNKINAVFADMHDGDQKEVTIDGSVVEIKPHGIRSGR